jgi:hypothetical protein
MAMQVRYIILVIALIVFSACKTEKPVEQKKPEHTVVVKPKLPLLSKEQREDLDFPDDLISKVELAAGAEAEPFYVTVVMRSENLKGDKGFENRKLAGFSVHTKKGDELIDRFRAGLRVKGFLIFKSHRGVYKNLPDIVSVVKGNNSYDILKIQSTEAQNYHLDTKAIIAWLKDKQKLATFSIIGAGPDWIEAKFIKPPKNMQSFAKNVVAFAPDVLEHGPQSLEKLAERMKRTNGFVLVWD